MNVMYVQLLQKVWSDTWLACLNQWTTSVPLLCLCLSPLGRFLKGSQRFTKLGQIYLWLSKHHKWIEIHPYNPNSTVLAPLALVSLCSHSVLTMPDSNPTVFSMNSDNIGTTFALSSNIVLFESAIRGIMWSLSHSHVTPLSFVPEPSEVLRELCFLL